MMWALRAKLEHHKVDGPPDLSYNRWDHSEWREGIHEAHPGLRDQHYSMCPGAVMWSLAASLGKSGKQVDRLSPPDREHMKKRLLSVLSAPTKTEHLLGHSICPADVAKWDGCPWHLKTRAGRSSVWSICMIWPLLPSLPRCWCTCKSKLVCSWVCAGDEELSRYTCD